MKTWFLQGQANLFGMAKMEGIHKKRKDKVGELSKYIPVLSNVAAISYMWLFTFKCSQPNKINTLSTQSYQQHFKCSKATGVQLLPIWIAQTVSISTSAASSTRQNWFRSLYAISLEFLWQMVVDHKNILEFKTRNTVRAS